MSQLTSVAFRTHEHEAMRAFYAEAFGVTFRAVKTGPLDSDFGELGAITLKLVPIRDSTDFDGFPVHQLGIEVDDVERVISLARKHGGAVQDAAAQRDGRVLASVRDPDGNTIELYARAR
jgi:predicted enzyme related to lactoylglutathione lyase